MMDIIKLGYNNEFSVDGEFDLNIIRKFKRVKKVGKAYIPDTDENSQIEIILGCNVTFEKKEVEKYTVEELTREKEQYSRWWNEEQTAKRKVDEELKCLKLDIQRMKDESAGGEK